MEIADLLKWEEACKEETSKCDVLYITSSIGGMLYLYSSPGDGLKYNCFFDNTGERERKSKTNFHSEYQTWV